MKDGEPLFACFDPEDWALVTLRYELYLMTQAFKKDVTSTDADRRGIHQTLFMFYYTKYFSKQMSPKGYGKATFEEVVEVIKDVAHFDSDNLLKAEHEEDLDSP